VGLLFFQAVPPSTLSRFDLKGWSSNLCAANFSSASATTSFSFVAFECIVGFEISQPQSVHLNPSNAFSFP